MIPNKSRLSISRLEITLGLMAIISTALLFLPLSWLGQTIVRDPHQLPILLTADTFSGGNSAIYWVDQSSLRWGCDLHSQFITPYCSTQFNLLDENDVGLDLTKFNSVYLKLHYRGDGTAVRIYLRNRHPNYYKKGNDVTTKYNMVEVPIEDLEHGITINLEDFGVADWWLVQQKIALSDSHPQFNDVVYLEIQSGSTDRSGHHEFQLQAIRFDGTLLSQADLYRGIVIAWCVAIFTLLFFRIVSLKIELNRHKQYQLELVSINNLLNLQNKQFEDLAKNDHLTGLLNRMGIRDGLYEGLKSWKTNQTPFSLVLIDIDHFKKVNDSLGHDVGDLILKGVANIMSENVRQNDLLARWGGEEFILVCANTDLAQASIVAEHLRKKIESSNIYKDLKVTASFGVATMFEANLDSLFKGADEALYEAKDEGRNRVKIKFESGLKKVAGQN